MPENQTIKKDKLHNISSDTQRKCVLKHTLQRDRNENNTGGQ